MLGRPAGICQDGWTKSASRSRGKRRGPVHAERTFSGPSESGQPSEQEPAAEPDPQASDPEAPVLAPEEVAVLSKRQRQRLRQRKGKESREKESESKAKEEAQEAKVEKSEQEMEAKVGFARRC